LIKARHSSDAFVDAGGCLPSRNELRVFDKTQTRSLRESNDERIEVRSVRTRVRRPFLTNGVKGRSRSRKSEPLEHKRVIELLPSLVHLPADDPVDDQSVDHHSLARRRGRANGTSVSPGSAPTKGHQIVLNQLILDREVEIANGPQEARGELLPRTDSAEWLRNAGDMDDAVKAKPGFHLRERGSSMFSRR
jgi:hypothetical protein